MPCILQHSIIAGIGTSLHLPSALLKQPPLLLRREERVHEVVVRLVRDLERLLLNVPIDGFLREVTMLLFSSRPKKSAEVLQVK